MAVTWTVHIQERGCFGVLQNIKFEDICEENFVFAHDRTCLKNIKQIISACIDCIDELWLKYSVKNVKLKLLSFPFFVLIFLRRLMKLNSRITVLFLDSVVTSCYKIILIYGMIVQSLNSSSV